MASQTLEAQTLDKWVAGSRSPSAGTQVQHTTPFEHKGTIHKLTLWNC